MTGPIDKAYVEIEPEIDNFHRKVTRELNDTFDDVEHIVDDAANIIEGMFDEAARDIDKSLDKMSRSSDDAFDKISREAGDAGVAIDIGINGATIKAKRSIDDLADDAGRDFDRIERSAKDASRNIGRTFAQGIASGASSAFETLAGFGNQLRGVGGVASSLGGIIQIAAIGALVPVIIGLVGALVDLSAILLALPAAAGILVAAIAPLVLAFHGMGEAIGALMSGDVDKLNEAMKKLSPSARAVVKEIAPLVPMLKEIQKSVQQAFFAPFIGGIKQLGTNLIPTLNRGLTLVATSLGNIGRSFLDMLASNDIVDTINDLFASTGRVVDRLGPSIVNFIGTLFGVMEHGLPFAERMFNVLASGIDSLSQWLSDAMSSGSFERWLESAFAIASDLWELFKALGVTMKLVFGDAGDEGQGFIQTLTDITTRLNNFLASDQGRKSIQATLDMIKVVGAALGWLVNAFIWFGNAVDGTINFILTIPTYISTAWNAVVTFFQGIWTAITGFITGLASSISGFFSALPGQISGWLSSLPGIFESWIRAAFERFFYWIGYGTAWVVIQFAALPGRLVGALVALRDMVVMHVQNLITTTIAFFSSLPGRMAQIANDLWSTVTGIFQRGVATAEGHARSLPGRIQSALSGIAATVRNAFASAISAAFGIGRDMIEGMIGGIRSAAGRLFSAARNAVMSALQGARDALLSRSPSKKWAELGVDSMQGYGMGIDAESDNVVKQVKHSISLPMDSISRRNQSTSTGVTSNNSGDFNGTILVQLGDEHIVNPVVRIIQRNSQDVALAVENGTTQLGRRR